MLLQAELSAMRMTSQSALPDTCRITRAGEDPTLDTTTGLLAPADLTTVYTGACRVRTREAQEQDAQVGELHETFGRYVATLPHDAEGIIVDDYLTVLTSSDADMVGRSFQVVHVGWGSWQIDRRIGLRDREQPQGISVGS